MKKALTRLVCYAYGMAALFLGAAEASISSINFETQNLWGKTPEFGLGLDGYTPSDMGYYWFCLTPDGNGSVIEEYGKGEWRYDLFDPVANPQPEYMKSADDNNGLLRVSAALEPLEYSIKPIDAATGPERENCVEAPETGLYLDLLAKFDTGFVNPEPSEYQSAGCKLCFGIQNDLENDKMLFTIVAGSVDAEGKVTASNYVTTATVTTGQWYRVTGRMFAQASTKDGATLPAYAIYLDGVPVVCDAATYGAAIGAGGDAYFSGNEHYERGGLFPSMQQSNAERYMQKAYTIAFKGNGNVDEIGVTAENIFAKPSDTAELVIVCNNEQLTEIAYEGVNAEGKVYTNGTLEADFNGFTLPVHPGATITLAPVAAAAVSIADELVVGGNQSIVESASGYAITFVEGESFADASRVTATISTKEGYFEVDGVAYAKFTEAMAAATAGSTVSVLRDVVLDGSARTDNGQARVKAGQDVIIDLKGKRIKGEHFDEEAAIYNQGTLAIVDTVGDGVIEASGTVVENDWSEVSTNTAVAVNHRVASLTIGDAGSKLFKVRGRVKCTKGNLFIRTGEYLTPKDETIQTDFYLRPYVDTDGRFEVSGSFTDVEGTFWRVVYNNKAIVSYSAEHGEVTPSSEVVAIDSLAHEPTLTKAYGYSLTGWAREDETLWNFATDTVTGPTKLHAVQTLDTYSIAYTGWSDERMPTAYTVETNTVKIAEPERVNFTFNGWLDLNSGNFVTEVGLGATFVGSDEPVHGDLKLEAQWIATPVRWANTGDGLSESNGTYSGSWTFKIPADEKIGTATKVELERISFCIVNPTQYPQTSQYLALKPTGGTASIAERKSYEVNPTTHEYVNVGTTTNGRAIVTYEFSSAVKVAVGETYYVYFCKANGDLSSGFLRLGHAPDITDPVFGKCVPEVSPISRYAEYVPLYEVEGRLSDE